MPIYEHLFDFYSHLVDDWSLEKLSLRLQHRNKATEVAHSMNNERVRAALIDFSKKIQNNKTLKKITFISDIPHTSSFEKTALMFVRSIARNFTIERIKLHIDNTLGLQLLPWRQKVLAQFYQQPSFKQMILFGNHILPSDYSLSTRLKNTRLVINQLIRQVCGYQSYKRELLSEAAVIDSQYKLSRHIGLEIQGFSQQCLQILLSRSSCELVVMGHIYYRDIFIQDPSHALLLKQRELFDLLSRSPVLQRQASKLFDICYNIISYLDRKDLDHLFGATAGVFMQIDKILKQSYLSVMPQRKALTFSNQSSYAGLINAPTIRNSAMKKQDGALSVMG
jgi:hypothetical protein